MSDPVSVYSTVLCNPDWHYNTMELPLVSCSITARLLHGALPVFPCINLGKLTNGKTYVYCSCIGSIQYPSFILEFIQINTFLNLNK